MRAFTFGSLVDFFGLQACPSMENDMWQTSKNDKPIESSYGKVHQSIWKIVKRYSEFLKR